MKNYLLSAAAVGALALAGVSNAGPAAAQKAKDTLRLVTIDPFNSVDAYYTGGNEVAFLARELYGRIVVFDEYNGKFIPELATSYLPNLIAGRPSLRFSPAMSVLQAMALCKVQCSKKSACSLA